MRTEGEDQRLWQLGLSHTLTNRPHRTIRKRVSLMAKRLKLPADFLGTVKALLNTPPPPNKRTVKKARKAAKKR